MNHDFGKKMFQKCLSVLLATILTFSTVPLTANMIANESEPLDDLVPQLAAEVDEEEQPATLLNWSFSTEQDSHILAQSNTLPTLAIAIYLEEAPNASSIVATYQWFARLANVAAHATGVPVTAPNEVDITEALDLGFMATLQLTNEFGIIPLTPQPGQNLATATSYTSENWEYFIVVTYHVDGELAAPTSSAEVAEDAVISLTVEHVDFVRNRPPRDYFPNVRDLVDDITVMPLERYLNDPFIFFEYLMGGDTLGTNGRVVTEDDWWERNAEIRDLVGYYWFGFLPYVPLENITITAPTLNINDNTTATTPLTGIIRSNGRVATGNFGTITMPSRAQIEASAFNLEDGIPVVIGGNAGFYTSHGIATLAAGGIANTALHPANNNITEFNTGSIMNTVWTSSRGLDALQILFERNGYGVDPEKSATIGVSIGGKQAMFRGVMDERVALTVPVESGAFGMTHLRNLVEGYIPIYEGHSFAAPWMRAQKPMNSWGFTGEAGWFAFEAPPGFIHPFGARVHPDYSTYRIPFDMHMVAALAAPRGLLSFDNDGTGSGNGWMNPFGQQLVVDAAREVYAFLGVPDNIGGRVRDQAHAVQARDNPFVAATLIAMFGDDNHVGSGRSMRAVGPIDVNPSLASTGNPPAYGFGVYSGIYEMGVSPFEVQSRFIQWARPGYHSVWTYTEVVTEGMPATIKAHTTAPDGTVIELLHWEHGNRNSAFTPELVDSFTATVQNGVATFEIEGDVGRYELRLLEVNARASAFFSGIDVNTALRSGASPGTSHMFRSFGFTSRINMDAISVYVANAGGTEFYLPSIAIEESADARVPQGWGDNVGAAGGWGGWIMEYGIGIPNQGAPGSANNRLFNNGAVILRNVQLEAMPGYTFEVSFQSGATNGNPINAAVLWPSSTAVQASQAFPHWPPAGGLTAAGGEAGAFGIRADNTRAYRPAPSTNFDVELTHSFNFDGEEILANLTSWVIDFDGAMNTRDFGVGFNFSDDFTVEWNGNTQVTITFNALHAAENPEMLIMRLRDAAGNAVNTYIRQGVAEATCDVVVDGRFAGAYGSEWRICEDGTLEIDEGVINWTGTLSPWQAQRGLITNIEITGQITAGPSLRALFRELTEVEGINGLTYFDTSATTSMYRMFFGLSGVTELDVTNFATNNVTNMALMFRDASSLVELDVSNFDTSNVTDMREMFRGTSIETLDLGNFDTGNVTNMNQMFTALHTLRELTLGESFNFIGTPNLVPLRQTEEFTGLWQGDSVALTSAQLMAQFDGSTMAGTFVRQVWTEADPEVCYIEARGRFANGATIGGAQWHLCDNGTLEIGSGFINWILVTSPWHAIREEITEIVLTGEVTAGVSLRSLFHDLENLEDIHNLSYLDTRGTTNMARMFRGASSLTDLDLSTFDTTGVTDMSWMFFGASGLESLDVTNFATNDVTNMALMFREVSSLTELDVSNFNTTGVTDMREMFRGMNSLTTLDLDHFDTSNVINMNHMFIGMSALTELILGDLFTPIGAPGIPRLN